MWNGGWIESLTLNNVRDLGGMPAQDGRKIRKNRLLRAGALTGATDSDVAILREHDVRVIVDLRSDQEVGSAPDPVMEGIRYIRNPLLPSRTDGITHEEELAAIVRKTYRGHEHMMELYGKMTHDDRTLARFRAFLGYALERREGALLWHCTAGKDRTGTTAAVLQMALGVPQELVMQDYLYSNDCLKTSYDDIMAQVLIQTNDERAIESARQMLLAREDYFQTFLTGMILEEGSIDAFMEKRLGLDEKTKAQLRDMYLE